MRYQFDSRGEYENFFWEPPAYLFLDKKAKGTLMQEKRRWRLGVGLERHAGFMLFVVMAGPPASPAFEKR